MQSISGGEIPYDPLSPNGRWTSWMDELLTAELTMNFDKETIQLGRLPAIIPFFEYQTSQHSIAKLSSYEVLFGQNPTSLQLPLPSMSTSPGPCEYSCQLQQKLIKSWEMVEANITECAERQKKNYGGHNTVTPMVVQKLHWMTQPKESWILVGLGIRKSIRLLTLELQMGSAKHMMHISQVQGWRTRVQRRPCMALHFL